MTIEAVMHLHQARPFVPFRVHLADGRHFDVEHPEFFARSQGGRTITVATPDEAFEYIDVLLVTSLTPLNGQGSRRKRRGA